MDWKLFNLNLLLQSHPYLRKIYRMYNDNEVQADNLGPNWIIEIYEKVYYIPCFLLLR